jgi:hypothetical protein
MPQIELEVPAIVRLEAVAIGWRSLHWRIECPLPRGGDRPGIQTPVIASQHAAIPVP